MPNSGPVKALTTFALISSSDPIRDTLQARTVPSAPNNTVAIRETRTCSR